MDSIPKHTSLGRRECIPILHTRGTHYEIGFDIGRTFASLIHSFLSIYDPLNQEVLPVYETPDGKRVYEETLNHCVEHFPQYVDEIKGTAEGAGVPFHKLFLLHMEDIVPNVVSQRRGETPEVRQAPVGCSSICVNQPNNEVLSHNEDALHYVLNHFYLVSAHVISEEPQGRWKVKEEKFTSLCYAGHLPGFTMSYNHHGFIYSINIINPKHLVSGKTPRYFLTRALLAAENLMQAQQILRDHGSGSADGISVNMTFLNQEGDRLFHNAEIGPALNGASESPLDILTASPGEHIFHTNKYLRLKNIEEAGGRIIDSSEHRLDALNQFVSPKKCEDVLQMLGDQSDAELPVYCDSGYVRTIATGVFDCVKRTWTIYADNPKTHEPLIVIPLQTK
ncbi:unnamed protein product [Bemisia tabaci]|uniref:Peptidase C45 hydrolase domain-containing protein n=1 Tax=Bemisia tabaci TaxID=7038 RepID=A0A9P0A8Y0_BEMTA|nr:unnamed protein product [Bemisia tabaci]